MSDSTEKHYAGSGQGDEPDADKIAKFLKANPGFLEQHPELLRDLRIPHETGQSVSLIEKLVAGLRKENAVLKEKLHTLIGNGHENDRLFKKTQKLILTMLEQNSLESIRQTLEQSIQEDFGACYCRLWLVAEMPDPGKQQLAAAQLKEVIRIIRKKKPYLGELKEEEYRLMFKDCPKEMSSVAVISLCDKNDKVSGVLAIGNNDKEHYKDDMSVSLLGFIGKAVARLISRNSTLAAPE